MLSLKRLRKELSLLQTDPVPDCLALPLESNILEWRFIIRGSVDTDYAGGYFHGKLKFPNEYPYKPPSIMFITPNGRFALNQRICMSMSDFHPETWSPLWSVGSILTGIVSFMNTEEVTVGSITSSPSERRHLATKSMEFNGKDKVFIGLFGDALALFAHNDEMIQSKSKGMQKQLAKREKQAVGGDKQGGDEEVKKGGSVEENEDDEDVKASPDQVASGSDEKEADKEDDKNASVDDKSASDVSTSLKPAALFSLSL